MTTLTTLPELEQTQLEYYDALHDQAEDDAGTGDPLTSIAFELNRQQRTIDQLLEGNRAFCDEILTLKHQLHELAATIADLQTDAIFTVPDEQLF